MQDLQVTIEVRFITLSDSFFERIGVDFDFNIKQNVGNSAAAGFTGPQPNSQGTVSPCVRRQRRQRGLDRRSAERRQQHRPDSGIFTHGLEHPLPTGQLCPGGAAIRRFRPHDECGGHGGLRDPQRHRGLLLHQRRAGRQAVERPPGAQGHVVQRPAGLRFRHVANALRDQRDPRGGRLRRRPTAGDRRALGRHVHDRAGRGLQRPPLRAPDDRPLLQQDRRRADLHLPGNRHDDAKYHAQRHRRPGQGPVQQQQRPARRPRTPA